MSAACKSVCASLGRDVYNIGESLPGAGLVANLLKHPGRIGVVVFRLDERIALVKLVEQRLEPHPPAVKL